MDYTYYTEFQSHETEFDELKSKDIEEKINRIEWINRFYRGIFMLTTNDKKIKLWKLHSKEEKKLTNLNFEGSTKSGNTLKIPKVKKGNKTVTAQHKKTFQHAHEFQINSLSLCSDNEHFLSADDLRINIWNLGITNEVYSVVDFPVENPDEPSEVITSANFSPVNPNLIQFSTSKGGLKLCDLRISSKFDTSSINFNAVDATQKKNFFSEIINSISQSTFSKNGDFLFTRDYITTKIFDIRKSNAPVISIKLCQYLEKHLCDLYESENIFDKFELASSPDSNFIISGTYSDSFHIVDKNGTGIITIPANFEQGKNCVVGNLYMDQEKKNALGKPDTSKKIISVAWNPSAPIVAVTNYNCIFIYNSSP